MLLLHALFLCPETTSLTVIGEVSTPAHTEELNRFRRVAVELGIEDRVAVLTNIPHRQMANHYLDADLFLQMSSREPASVSQLEAMAHGLGIIVAPDNGTAAYVRHSVNGYICEPNAESLAKMLVSISDDKTATERLGKASAEIAVREFSPDRVTDAFISMLRS